MRKLLYIFFVLLMFAACDIHTSDNGDLDGYWQLRSVDTLSTGALAICATACVSGVSKQISFTCATTTTKSVRCSCVSTSPTM